MPTILRQGPSRFYWYSNEADEPPHIHVDRDNLSVKFWLNSVEVARNLGFSVRELNRIRYILNSRKAFFLEVWHEHHGT